MHCFGAEPVWLCCFEVRLKGAGLCESGMYGRYNRRLGDADPPATDQ